MSDTKQEALSTLDVPAGTYQTYVRPHQLRATDQFLEAANTVFRNVMIEKIEHGEIEYRNHLVPVIFVHGRDRSNHQKVVYTRTPWDFMEVARIGDAPVYVRSVKSLDQYVY